MSRAAEKKKVNFLNSEGPGRGKKKKPSLEHSIFCQNAVVVRHDGLVVPQEGLRVLHYLVGVLYESHASGLSKLGRGSMGYKEGRRAGIFWFADDQSTCNYNDRSLYARRGHTSTKSSY